MYYEVIKVYCVACNGSKFATNWNWNRQWRKTHYCMRSATSHSNIAGYNKGTPSSSTGMNNGYHLLNSPTICVVPSFIDRECTWSVLWPAHNMNTQEIDVCVLDGTITSHNGPLLHTLYRHYYTVYIPSHFNPACCGPMFYDVTMGHRQYGATMWEQEVYYFVIIL